MYSLIGVDGNAFYVMAYVSKAMKECGYSKEEISNYHKLCQEGTYDQLIVRSMEWIEKCNEVKDCL